MHSYDVTIEGDGIWRMPSPSEEDALKSVYSAFKYATGENLSYEEFKGKVEEVNKI